MPVRTAKGEVEPHTPSGTAVKVQPFADVTEAVVVLQEKLTRRASPRARGAPKVLLDLDGENAAQQSHARRLLTRPPLL